MDISVKAVLLDERNRLLLGLNPRAEWELLGGRADPGDADPAATLHRELREEAGLAVTVGALVDVWYYRPEPSRSDARVAVVSYLARVVGTSAAVASEEHGRLRWFALDEVDGLPIPEGYRATVRRVREALRRA
ncbi:NUDIX hydrolase [Tersicoccus sp. MR15.9]|uniref:NUDIX hydrolase n=1 Tax=Tersicoccus mangrovi TaxID=3121635 RepID=UPI002FE55861